MRKQLSKKEAKEFNTQIEQKYGITELISKKDALETFEDENGKRLVVNGEHMFFFFEDELYPLLKWVLKNDVMKKVTVDMGAVKFVTSGADIMRPGVTKFEEGLKQYDVVVVIDENNQKPLAIAMMLFSSEEASAMESGKVLKNLHFVGDKLWNA
jgi:PUA domain protein